MPEITETTRSVQAADEGLLRSFISMGSGLSETTVEGVLGGVEDLRSGAFRHVRGLIDWAEGTQKANIELARKLTDRVDTVTRAFLRTSEQALKTVVLTTRETSHGVVDTASRSAATFVSKPAQRPQPQA